MRHPKGISHALALLITNRLNNQPLKELHSGLTGTHSCTYGSIVVAIGAHIQSKFHMHHALIFILIYVRSVSWSAYITSANTFENLVEEEWEEVGIQKTTWVVFSVSWRVLCSRSAMRSPLRFFTIKHLMHFQVQRTVCKYSKSEPGFGSWPWLPKASPKAVSIAGLWGF